MKKRIVHIITPSYDGKTACNFAISMAEIFRLSKDHPDIELRLNFWMHEALLQKARNNLFSDAYLGGADDIVFIDADQSFNAQAFYRLLSHPVDVAALPVRMKTDEERYNIRPEDVSRHIWHEDLNLLEVENIGTGFLRLSRKAQQAIWDASVPYYDDGKERRMICNLQIINGGLISEDIQICNKLKDAGLKVYVDISETCKHFGTKCWEGDYYQHLCAEVAKLERDSSKAA